MKNLIKYAFMTLAVTIVISVLPTEAEGKIYSDTLRLHILANSDSAEDQELKLNIRDKLLLKYGELLGRGKSVDEAKDTVATMLSKIEEDAEGWISEMGYDYSVHASLSEEWYDTREYEGFTLPAGYYSSLQIIIGEGKGRNWWCVMYPPLCLDMATENAPHDDGLIDYSKEEIFLISRQEYQIKFKILEDLSRIFAKNG